MASNFFSFSFFPRVKAQEAAEEDIVDPQETLREKCKNEKHCAHLYEKYLECNDRVNGRSKTSETCVEELFDYLHGLDHCVTPKLFPQLK